MAVSLIKLYWQSGMNMDESGEPRSFEAVSSVLFNVRAAVQYVREVLHTYSFGKPRRENMSVSHHPDNLKENFNLMHFPQMRPIIALCVTPTSLLPAPLQRPGGSQKDVYCTKRQTSGQAYFQINMIFTFITN